MQCYVNRKCTVKGSTIYFSAGEVGAGRGSGVECVCVGVCVCVRGVGLFFFSQIFFFFFFFFCWPRTKTIILYMAREPIYSLKMGRATQLRWGLIFFRLGIGALRGCVRTLSTIGTDALQVRDWYSPGVGLIFFRVREWNSPEVRTNTLQGCILSKIGSDTHQRENDRRKYFMINLHERMLPTSVGVEPATTWSPVGRRIQLSHRCRLTRMKNDNTPALQGLGLHIDSCIRRALRKAWKYILKSTSWNFIIPYF